MHSSLDILEAIATDDGPALVRCTRSCDAQATILALGSAWVTLAEKHCENVPELLAAMRERIPALADLQDAHRDMQATHPEPGSSS